MSSRRRPHGLLAMNNRAFDIRFKSSAFLLLNTPSKRRFVSQHNKFAVQRWFTNEGAFHTRFPIFCYHTFHFFGDIVIDIPKRCSFVSTGTPFCSYFGISVATGVSVLTWYYLPRITPVLVSNLVRFACVVVTISFCRYCSSLRYNFPFLFFRYNTCYIRLGSRFVAMSIIL